MSNLDHKIVKVIVSQDTVELPTKTSKGGRPRLYTDEERAQRNREKYKAYYESNKEKCLQQSKQKDQRLYKIKETLQQLLDSDYPLPQDFIDRCKELKMVKKT